MPRSTRPALAIALFALALTLASPAFARPLVVVDAGHGGAYNHARYGTLLEKQANLLLAFELGRQLYDAGYDVRFTRTTDTALTYGDIPTWHWVSAENRWVYATDGIAWYDDGVPRDDLQARSNVANDMGADIFISIHCNGSSSSAAHGTENWASSHDVLGQQLGQYVQQAVLEQTHQRDRGAGVTDFYVVRWANAPALLIETGFLSNPSEGAAIANPSWRQLYVRGIVNGVSRWWATNPLRPLHPRYTAATHSETAVMASRNQWPDGAETVLLAATTDTASALAAPLATAKLGAPLLFADIRGLSDATKAELTRLQPDTVLVLGDAVPDEVLTDAAAAAGIDDSAVQRLAGSEPASVASLVSSQTVSADTPITMVFASVANHSDALAAASYAATRNGALLLTRADGTLPPEAAAFLAVERSSVNAAVIVGGVPSSVAAGLPQLSIINSADSYYTFSSAIQTSRPTGGLWLYGFNPLIPTDGLIAACAAANRLGGAPVPVTGRSLSPYTREWLENQGGRVFAATMVGDYNALPPIADHYLTKAIY
jgi:N-acetylmuramoyl-L-alanine amidase